MFFDKVAKLSIDVGFTQSCKDVIDQSVKKICKEAVIRTTKIDNRKIIFLNFSGNYDCNPKAICQRMIDEGLDAHYVWATYKRTRKGPAFFPTQIKFVLRGSYEFYKEISSARVIVDNGISTSFLGYHKKKDQYLIETWHGSLGIKKFGRDANNNKEWLADAEREGKMTDFIISNSSFEDEVYREDFWKTTPIWRFGHPRNDILFCTDREKIRAIDAKIRENYGIPKNAHMCLYAPTFREDGDLSPYVLDYNRLTEALKTRFGGDWVILTRFHARTKKFLKNYQLPETVINVSGYPDIQELMLCIDCGITDYSSWICEYMLRRKPGFTFATDVDNYSSHERTLFFPLSALPFPTSSNIDDLIANILAFDEEQFILDCNRFLEEKGSIDDGHAAERTVKEIKKLMGL